MGHFLCDGPYEPKDDIDKLSSRPDFSVLIYPAYMIEKDRLKDEIRVNAKTPPAFLVHADNDPFSSLGSAEYYSALKRAGVRASVHVFADGGHGFGMRKKKMTVGAWPQLAEAWLKSHQLLGK